VDDLIRGMMLMMNNEKNFIGPVNIWTEYEITIKDLAEKVIELIPWCTSKIIYKDLPRDDPKHRRPDNKLAKQVLWWEPCINIDEWLKKTIQYFESLIK